MTELCLLFFFLIYFVIGKKIMLSGNDSQGEKKCGKYGI